jgi:exosome complex RNA-binding protein Rrp4
MYVLTSSGLMSSSRIATSSRGPSINGRWSNVITYPIIEIRQGMLSNGIQADDQLRNGHLLTLPPRLIRRLKSHFHHLPPPCGPTGVDIILGLNGFVWVSSGTVEERREGGEGFGAEGVYSDKNDVSRLLTYEVILTSRIYRQRVEKQSRLLRVSLVCLLSIISQLQMG